MDIQTLIRDTQNLVKETLRKFNKPAVACSFGLDSMMALYFCREIIPDIPVIFVDSRCEYPDTYRFMKKIVPEWNLNLIHLYGKHTFQWIVGRHGFPLYSRGNLAKYSRKYLPAHYCCLYLKRRPLEQYIHKAKYDVIIDGMRADESLMRKYWIKKGGVLHYHKGNRSYRYHPLAYWTREQEEMASNLLHIPINPLYEKKLEGTITRTGCWCCTMNWKYKRGGFLRKFYPNLWKILMINYGLARYLLTRKLGKNVSKKYAERIVKDRPCLLDTPP